MENIELAFLADDVLTELAADPSDPVIESAIRSAAIEFCAGAWIWQHIPEMADVTAGEQAIDLEVPSGAMAATVLQASLDGVPLAKRTVQWLSQNLPRWRSDTGTPRYFTQIDTDQLLLAPLPASSIAGKLDMVIALQPDLTAVEIPKWLVSKYRDALVAGAVARLMLMPRRPWSDPQGGAIRASSFATSIAGAREDTVAAFGGAPLRTTSAH